MTVGAARFNAIPYTLPTDTDSAGSIERKARRAAEGVRGDASLGNRRWSRVDNFDGANTGRQSVAADRNGNGNIKAAGVGNANSARRAGDFEKAFVDTQTEYIQELEKELNDGLAVLEARNAELRKLNAVIDGLNKALALFPGDAKSSDSLDGAGDSWRKDPALEREINTALVEADVHPGLHPDGPPASTNLVDKDGRPITLPGGVTGAATKAELEALVTKVKGMLESAGNKTQIDMVKIQDKMGKLGTATGLLSNVLRKLEDMMAKIIANIH